MKQKNKRKKMTRPEETKKNKERMLKALEKSLGIVTPACKEVGISRQTYHRWYSDDDEFKRKVDDINDVQADFVENQLFKKIKEGSERSILFYMRYKGKNRGYTDSIDITSDGKSITEIKLIEIKKDDDLDGENAGS